MGFWKKLLGRSNTNETPPPTAVTPAPTDIKVYDSYGRELYIAREQWRTSVLPSTLAAARSYPEKLYETIAHALQDGFFAEVLEPAQHLAVTDPKPIRGACLLGVIYTNLNRLDEAETVLLKCMEKHGEDGVVMTNLAKVYAARGENTHVEPTLWHALELDPNQRNGLEWYVALQRERDGDAAAMAAYKRVAALPGSWRAQLWLARGALERGEIDDALACYGESLSRLAEPDADTLMMISGDLGNHGRLAELLALVAPRFHPDAHGLIVGNNLLKAYIDLSRFDDARRVLSDLYGLQRPDYREVLGYWEKLLDDRTRGFGPVTGPAKPAIAVVPYAGVVWAREKEGLITLLPDKRDDAPGIAVMAASCALASPGDEPRVQRTNAEGAFSRALTLALVEVVHLDTTAEGIALVPVVQDETAAGFVLSNAPWDDTQVVALAKGQGPSVGLAVNLHLETTQASWNVTMTILRVSDDALIERMIVAVDAAAPEQAVKDLSEALKPHCLRVSGVDKQARPAWATLPTGTHRASWMAACEQTLAIQFASIKEGPRIDVYAPRSIIDGLLEACLQAPTSVLWRMLLLTALNRLKENEPDVVAEYAGKLAQLQREHVVRAPCAAALGTVAATIVERP